VQAVGDRKIANKGHGLWLEAGLLDIFGAEIADRQVGTPWGENPLREKNEKKDSP
jgi:hypothetical protein